MTDESELCRWEDDGGWCVEPPEPSRQRPTFDFDESPARTTRERLEQIPDLVAQVVLTIGAPNPGDEVGRTPRVPGSRPPIDLGVLDLLRTHDHRDEDHSSAPLIRLGECSRLVWQSLDVEARQRHPQPCGELAWRTEASWLANVWSEAQLVLDLADMDWIESEVREIHAALRSAARLRREPAYACPRCAGSMVLTWSGSVLECVDCRHTERTDLESRYRRRSPMPTSLIVSEFSHLGVTAPRLWQWKRRRKITCAETPAGSRESWFWPWDVLLLASPDIAEAVARRESA
ncbi:hypothetical protein CGZ93_17840 [Enemella dayhoffiae]|uniref:Uncharacterized protein n=1 Tax=Enemella dayhoffiae TaxID=2016507 RepID=A0A255GMK0_9ACTN|nr:hypothetical protein [Enemella dayhoffiae]OYO16622.1 hypothetical protein CGZ93_17840 [Enemella dayhoffiae]